MSRLSERRRDDENTVTGHCKFSQTANYCLVQQRGDQDDLRFRREHYACKKRYNIAGRDDRSPRFGGSEEIEYVSLMTLPEGGRDKSSFFSLKNYSDPVPFLGLKVFHQSSRSL